MDKSSMDCGSGFEVLMETAKASSKPNTPFFKNRPPAVFAIPTNS